jgi:hypothetical protein
LAALLLFGFVAFAAFLFVARPVLLRLGTTHAEASDTLPGDEYVAADSFRFTQAIDIDAPPDALWRWLVQVGYKRGGWYNVDPINRLAGPNYFDGRSGSAERIYSKYQNLAEGDQIHLAPSLGMTVVLLDSPRAMLLVGNPSERGGDNVAWTFMIYSRSPGSSRLVTRFRSPAPSGFTSYLVNLLVNEIGGATIQQPAMLWGIKTLAEKEARKK